MGQPILIGEIKQHLPIVLRQLIFTYCVDVERHASILLRSIGFRSAFEFVSSAGLASTFSWAPLIDIDIDDDTLERTVHHDMLFYFAYTFSYLFFLLLLILLELLTCNGFWKIHTTAFHHILYIFHLSFNQTCMLFHGRNRREDQATIVTHTHFFLLSILFIYSSNHFFPFFLTYA